MISNQTFNIINCIQCTSSRGFHQVLPVQRPNKKQLRFHDNLRTHSCKLSTGFNISSYELIFIHICHKGIGNVVYLDVF